MKVPRIKGVILSVEDVILPMGESDDVALFEEIEKLINFFKSREIIFTILANRSFRIGEDPLEDRLKEHWGDFPYFCTSKDHSIPKKPLAASTAYVLEQLGWRQEEVVYIGASDSDMKTAVNGKLLFLRATWWNTKTDYGFEFDSPKDIARYIDTFCLREHHWCHEIHDQDFHFYALAPFSTFREEHTLYSADARSTAKNGKGHPDFWVGALVSSIYFSGLYKEINYITSYPGHRPGSGNSVMDEAVAIFGKCFRINYIPDLIIRHTQATKSQTARRTGITIGHENQLNTIFINPTPRKNSKSCYSSSPLRKGKCVLVIDDFCTRGYSLESARAYLRRTGVKVITASWLKTINSDIETLANLGRFDPYQPNTFEDITLGKKYLYRDNIVDIHAPDELTKQFKGYEGWDWS